MTTASATLPDALGEAAREFVAGPHRLLIGASAPRPPTGARSRRSTRPAAARSRRSPTRAPRTSRAAVAAAREAFAVARGRSLPAAERERLMLALAEAVEDHAEELAQIESLDNGKPVKLAQFVDVRWHGRAPALLRRLAHEDRGRRAAGRRAPGMHCYTRREPVGVCGQIIPWNFPLLMASWKLAPALAAGCTIVLKPAEQTPLSALRLGELALEVGFPPGVLNVLTGDGATGAALVDHPGVDKIAFTGSTAVGREIGAKAGRALKRVTLELGGKSPNVILPDADIDAAVKGAYQAIYFNSGQACNAGSRLFVPAERFDEVMGALAERAAATRAGPGPRPRHPARAAGLRRAARARAGLHRVRPRAGRRAAHRRRGRAAPTAAAGSSRRRCSAPPPTSCASPARRSSGRCSSPRRTTRSRRSPRRANAGEYGLAAGVWTRDVCSAHRLAAMLRAGWSTSTRWGGVDPAAPFGGFKASGVGREHGRDGLDAYLETKTVWTAL